MMADVNQKIQRGEIILAADVDLNNLPANVRYARDVYGADPGQRHQIMMTIESQGDLAQRQRAALEAHPVDDVEGKQALKIGQRNERKKHTKEVSGDLYRNLAGTTKYERFIDSKKKKTASEVERLEDPNEPFQASPLVPERGRSVK
ncbi:hypothetical protein HDU96_004316, partial [Phlyctochytrium bullatum]